MIIFINNSWINTDFISQVSKGYQRDSVNDVAHFIDEETVQIHQLKSQFYLIPSKLVIMNNGAKHVFVDNTTCGNMLQNWIDSKTSPGAP